MVRGRIHRGFSLVEVIVAAMILSGAVVAICSISTRSFLGVKLNRDYEQAWDMLDRQMTMIDYMGVDQFLELAETSGICEGDTTGVVHYWQAVVTEEEIPGLYAVNVAISWQDGPRLRQVTARTMLNGAPVVEEAESEQMPPEGEGGDRSQGSGAQGGGGSQGGGQGTSTSGSGQGTSTSGGGGRGSQGGGGSRGGGESRGGGGESRGGGGDGSSGGGGGSRGGGGGGGGGSGGGRR